jgi:3-isopropylmalate dehydrogenase
VAQAKRVLEQIASKFNHEFSFEEHLMGGIAIDETGDPLPEATLLACKKSDAVLLSAVGGPKWDDPKAKTRPEKGLLAIRKGLGLFANLRPVRTYPELIAASPLKEDRIRGVDLLVVRELTGGLYFGKQYREQTPEQGEKAVDTLEYTEAEVHRVVKLACELARGRRKLVTSVDKANVLETSQLWRSVVSRVAGDYPDVSLQHMYVDACAMAIVTAPTRFDVILTENLFGDILSDEAAVIAGSIGLLPSASLGDGPGLFEPVHGSAPDIAGRDLANPVGAIASAAMLLEHGLRAVDEARAVERAIERVLSAGHRTADLSGGGPQVSCERMAELIAAEIGNDAGV